MSRHVDWQKVVDLNPTGEVEMQDATTVIRGQLKSLTLSALDNVVIELEWAASMPSHGNPGFGKWTEYTELKFVFPNLLMPFEIQDVGEKGKRILFGFNLIYLNRIEGVNTLDRSIVQKKS